MLAFAKLMALRAAAGRFSAKGFAAHQARLALSASGAESNHDTRIFNAISACAAVGLPHATVTKSRAGFVAQAYQQRR
jgi:hypothetical protein